MKSNMSIRMSTKEYKRHLANYKEHARINEKKCSRCKTTLPLEHFGFIDGRGIMSHAYILKWCPLRPAPSCLSCEKKYREAQAEKARKRNNVVTLLKSYRSSADSRGYDFELTLQQFEGLVTSPCYYCGSSYEESRSGFNGVDRVDNGVGYLINNVVPCCGDCNFGKGRKTEEEFVDWLLKAASYQLSKKGNPS